MNLGGAASGQLPGLVAVCHLYVNLGETVIGELPNHRAPTGLSVTSVALLSQIRAVDRIRLIKRLGAVDDETLEQVDEAIKVSLGLIKL